MKVLNALSNGEVSALCFGRMPPFFHPSNQHLLTVSSFSWQMRCPEVPGGARTEALFLLYLPARVKAMP